MLLSQLTPIPNQEKFDDFSNVISEYFKNVFGFEFPKQGKLHQEFVRVKNKPEPLVIYRYRAFLGSNFNLDIYISAKGTKKRVYDLAFKVSSANPISLHYRSEYDIDLAIDSLRFIKDFKVNGSSQQNGYGFANGKFYKESELDFKQFKADLQLKDDFTAEDFVWFLVKQSSNVSLIGEYKPEDFLELYRARVNRYHSLAFTSYSQLVSYPDRKEQWHKICNVELEGWINTDKELTFKCPYSYSNRSFSYRYDRERVKIESTIVYYSTDIHSNDYTNIGSIRDRDICGGCIHELTCLSANGDSQAHAVIPLG